MENIFKNMLQEALGTGGLEEFKKLCEESLRAAEDLKLQRPNDDFSQIVSQHHIDVNKQMLDFLK